MFPAGGVWGLMGEGFGAAEVDRSVLQGIDKGDAGLYGEEVMVDVVAGGEGGGCCGWVGHVHLLKKWSRHVIAVKRIRWQLYAG
ncbi:hypothetical protein AM274_30955 [Pseudomonas nunensis]|nr:hypothetical protein AM274_30955 [Pseudomonas nunensis]